MTSLSYSDLHTAVDGAAAGIRARTALEPLGGPGDKIFPPTYSTPPNSDTQYAVERRRVGGDSVDAVVLDSVASQANRMELALLDAYRAGELQVPVVSVDFRDVPDLVGLDLVSSLEASHRIFDAALRDSLLDDAPFRISPEGQRITEATPRNAAALFHYSPTTLLFGGWDSTGPRGGLGSKYERAITSEIVALGVERGVKTASRIDVLGTEKDAGVLWETPDGEWTLDEGQARREKGQPVKYRGGSSDSPGRPSQVNHGNVTPSVETRAGGVTADQILAVVVLSFAALRKLRFPATEDGAPLPPERRAVAEGAARTALAALGLAATVLSIEDGLDLRSRCVLIPSGPVEFELLHRDGSPPTRFTLDRNGALELFEQARTAADAAGLTWRREELLLRPADKLVDLIRRSQDVTARQEVAEPAGS